MRDSSKRLYWDSCVILHYLNQSKEWLPILDSLIDEASLGNGLVIYTSTVTITEVAFAAIEKTKRSLDLEIEEKIDALWADRSVITLVEFNPVIARNARQLMRRSVAGKKSDPILTPKDAIHLATAANRSVVEMHSTDDKLIRATPKDIGFEICFPRSEKPKLFTL